jgi:hypothetical protein
MRRSGPKLQFARREARHEPGGRVRVWVFALQTCQDPGAYDPRSIDQWEFRVMPHRQLLATGQKSARLPFFDRFGVAPVRYPTLDLAPTERTPACSRLMA